MSWLRCANLGAKTDAAPDKDTGRDQQRVAESGCRSLLNKRVLAAEREKDWPPPERAEGRVRRDSESVSKWWKTYSAASVPTTIHAFRSGANPHPQPQQSSSITWLCFNNPETGPTPPWPCVCAPSVARLLPSPSPPYDLLPAPARLRPLFHWPPFWGGPTRAQMQVSAFWTRWQSSASRSRCFSTRARCDTCLQFSNPWRTPAARH